MNASDDHLDWLGFFVFGVLLSAYGLYAITLPDLMPDHWDWLTSDENAVEYITGVFRIIGLNALGFGIFVSIASATAYRKDKGGPGLPSGTCRSSSPWPYPLHGRGSSGRRSWLSRLQPS